MKNKFLLNINLVAFVWCSYAYCAVDSTADFYIELLKKCLTGFIYFDPQHTGASFNKSIRELGRDWPSQAHTMIGIKRMDNLQMCIESVIQNGIVGDFIETGVWRGGATIFMRGVLKAYGIVDRIVWVADSFEGLPEPNIEKYPQDQGLDLYRETFLKVSLEEVKNNFELYGLLDEKVKFIKGWFRDTLPFAPIEKLAILRLDGDLYESTMDSLTNLYDKVSIGGFIIIDDYSIPACGAAVHDFRASRNITEPIVDIDGAGAYWKKLYV